MEDWEVWLGMGNKLGVSEPVPSEQPGPQPVATAPVPPVTTAPTAAPRALSYADVGLLEVPAAVIDQVARALGMSANERAGLPASPVRAWDVLIEQVYELGGIKRGLPSQLEDVQHQIDLARDEVADARDTVNYLYAKAADNVIDDVDSIRIRLGDVEAYLKEAIEIADADTATFAGPYGC